MNIEIVTPAGRKRYLEILAKYVNKLYLNGSINKWNLWLNTQEEEDIAFIRELAEQNDFIEIKELTVPLNEGKSIYSFWKYCNDPETIYVRMDDDVVFVETEAFDDFIKYRINDKKHFLVYANIINNSILTHIHQKMGVLSKEYGECDFDCFSQLSPVNHALAKHIHETFINKVNNGNIDEYKFDEKELNYPERCSINCFAIMGADIIKCSHIVWDEEEWLSVTRPTELKRKNIIYGKFLVSHFAFFPQRKDLDQTDILSKYKALWK